MAILSKHQTGALTLAAMLAFSAQAEAKEARRDGPEFNQRTPQALIPVDCDLMGLNGEETIAFVKQYGIWGHVESKERMKDIKKHLKSHGIEQEHYDRARDLCQEHFTQ